MATVYLGIGSNLRPEHNFKLAVQELARRFELIDVSQVYRNKAVGFKGDDFLNAVACIATTLSPQELSDNLEEIHDLAGRRRGASANVSRTLDIDLLLYDDLVVNNPPLQLPRDDILLYPFVLGPLAEIAPKLVHPETGRTMASHWADVAPNTYSLTKEDLVF